MLTYKEIMDKINTSKEDCFRAKITEEMADRLVIEGVDLYKRDENLFNIYTTKLSLETPVEIDLDNVKNLEHMWISPTGKIYNVEWCNHYLAARSLGSYTDTRHEKKGWLHISESNIVNYHKVKMTDKQYDAVHHWAEVNNKLEMLRDFIRDNEQK